MTICVSSFNSDLFGKKKDDSFDSAINQIRQTFGRKDIYPSIEEKAAVLLYLIVKTMHLWTAINVLQRPAFYFLERNQLLFDANGSAIISNDALAALTLFVASSKKRRNG